MYFRSQAEASALEPIAVRWISELERQLPLGYFDFHLDTVFVGRTVTEEIGCVAVTVPGVRLWVLPLEFALTDSQTPYVDELLSLRDRLMEQRAET
ncbi:hypothetical protein [Leifsonia shinshuensis]|uniref:Uncharacterized protein n=1 Tax=Leifsonia shinshuensis TaxID=150026 RepID=A0A7G6YBL3_9MICO|nr:hypothetical protein [Leifsonia shinshuensis]QNE35878.1 hypothetical protein F1C12_12570 [Leifsonia shinshuensis]